MKPIPLAIVIVLLIALHLLQSRVLEKTEVQRLERESQNLRHLPASSLLPTYIGSLFLGSFRAVAIDILWIQMQRMREQEHRYFETVEYMELITKLQPRNPEAWAYMAWDAGYNIANQFRTEEDWLLIRELQRRIDAGAPQAAAYRERIKKIQDEVIPEKDKKFRIWIKRGLLTLHEGSQNMPEDVYLQYEIGMTLWNKAARPGEDFDWQFINAIEDDDDLQNVLGDGLDPKKRTTFELAEAWFQRGQATLERLISQGRFRVFRTIMENMSRPAEERLHHTTQMGRNLDRAAFAGAIHQMRYFNGILKWTRARGADPATRKALLLEASENFKKAGEQARFYRERYSPIVAEKRAFHDARAEMCEGLWRLTADQAEWTEDRREEMLARLELIRWNPIDRQAAPMDQVPPPDEGYVLEYMGGLKRSLGGDGWEYNDDLHSLNRSNYIAPGERADATIGPTLEDVDCYHFYAARESHEGHDHAPPPAKAPILSDFRIKRMGTVPLTVTVYAFSKERFGVVQTLEIDDAEEHPLTVESDRDGAVFLRVTAKSPSNTQSTDSGYWIRAVGVRH